MGEFVEALQGLLGYLEAAFEELDVLLGFCQLVLLGFHCPT
jgi:hypothetical protein